MNIRRIAAAAAFATGAALALAPLASADVTGIDPATVVDSEISAENHLFEFEALLAGESNDITVATTPGAFDTIPASDIPTTAAGGAPTTLEYELYGVNPIAAGISGGTGPFNEFNGALTQFDNAFNAELYSLFNGGNFDANINDYIFNKAIDTLVLTPGETTTAAFDTLYNNGINDLSGFFQTDLSSLLIPTTTADVAPAAADPLLGSIISGEISSANSFFESGAGLTGASSEILTNTGTFDTIPVSDLTTVGGAAAPFDYFLFGLNPLENSTGDPGAYDLFNGAISKFDDAINFGVYALENGGNAIPSADWGTDLFGIVGSNAATELTGETAFQAIGTLLQDSLSDLAGYFDIGSVATLF